MSIQIVRFDTDVEYTAARVGDGSEFLLTLRITRADTNPLWAGRPVAPQAVTVPGRYAR